MSDGIHNAIIEKATLSAEDHGFLIGRVTVRHGTGQQCFGGYNLSATGGNYAASFIQGTLKVAGVSDWDRLAGKSIRIREKDGYIVAIGHTVDEVWYCPDDEFPNLDIK